MKNYQNTVILQTGEVIKNNVTTTQTAQEQGEYLWENTSNVFLVEVLEDVGGEWGKDRYVRNQ